jgi:signal peptidase
MIHRLQSFLYFAFIALVASIAILLVAVQTSLIGGLALLIVSSGSMEPAIGTGSVVVVIAQDRYNVNDVVTFGSLQGSSIPTTHRIIGEQIQSGALVYETQGDANDDPDARPVRESEIIGKVAFSIPYLGFLLDFARQPIGFITLIVIPALFIAFEEVSVLIREWRSKRRNSVSNSLPTAADPNPPEKP